MDFTTNYPEYDEVIKKVLENPPSTTCEESEQIIYKSTAKKKKDPKLYYEHMGHYCWVLLHRISEEYYITPQTLMQIGFQEGINIWVLLVVAIINEAQDDEDAWRVTDTLVTGLLNKILVEMKVTNNPA
jgi:hypothetical protein